MEQTKNILRERPVRRAQGMPVRRAQGRQWLVMLLALFAWLLPQTALADGDFNTYVDMSYNYGVSLSFTGISLTKIALPWLST